MLAYVMLPTLLGGRFRPSTVFPMIALDVVLNSGRRWSTNLRNIMRRQ